MDEEVKPEVVFKEEPESDGFDGDYDPENGDSDYEPERKPRKIRSAPIVRKPKTENDEGGGDDGCDSKSGAKV